MLDRMKKDTVFLPESIERPVPIMRKIRNPENSARGIAYIPLTRDFNPFIAMREGQFAGKVTSLLGVIDKSCTPLWYVAVAQKILYDASTPGIPIEFMNSGSSWGLVLKLLVLIPVGCIAFFNVYLEHLEQEKELEKTKSEFQHINKVIEDIEKGKLKEKMTEKEMVGELINIFRQFNEYLGYTIRENEELKEKYAFIEIEFPENTEVLTFQETYDNTRFKVVAKNSPEAAYPRVNYWMPNLLEEKRNEPDLVLNPAIEENDEDDVEPLFKPEKPNKEIIPPGLEFYAVPLLAEREMDEEDEIKESHAQESRLKKFFKKIVWEKYIYHYFWEEFCKKTFWEKWIKEYIWEDFIKCILWNKAIKPLYNAVNLVSFGYWALCIVMLIATGQLAPAGIFGVPNWVSFIVVPVVFGVPYLAIRAVNYCTRIHRWRKEGHGLSFKEFEEHARLQHQAEEDFTKVARQTRENMEYDAEWDRLHSENLRLTIQLNAFQKESDQKDSKSHRVQPKYAFRVRDRPYESKYAQAAATGVTSLVNNQVALHYGSWFANDMMTAGLGLTIGATVAGPIGHALLTISCLYGMVSTAYRYRQAKKASKAIADHQKDAKTISFEEYKRNYEEKEMYYAHLKMRLYTCRERYALPGCINDPENDLIDTSKKTILQLFANVGRNILLWFFDEPSDVRDSAKQFFKAVKEKVIDVGMTVRNSKWIQAWDWEMAGIFFSRVIVPAVTVACFWAIPTLAVVFAFSNPITLAVVVGLGALYLGLKWYEKKYKLKEKEMVELPEKDAKLDKNIAMAEAALDNIQIKETLRFNKEKKNADKRKKDVDKVRDLEYEEKPLTFQRKIEDNMSANRLMNIQAGDKVYDNDDKEIPNMLDNENSDESSSPKDILERPEVKGRQMNSIFLPPLEGISESFISVPYSSAVVVRV